MKKLKIALLTMILVMGCSATAFAAGDVFTAGESLLGDVQTFIVKISTAAAVIGIGFGALTVKFAGGNAQKIDKGFTAIKWSIGAWTLVNGAMMIFATVDKYIS